MSMNIGIAESYLTRLQLGCALRLSDQVKQRLSGRVAVFVNNWKIKAGRDKYTVPKISNLPFRCNGILSTCILKNP